MAAPIEVLLCTEDLAQFFSAACFLSSSGAQLTSFKCGGDPIKRHGLCIIKNKFLLAASSSKPVIHVWPFGKKEQSIQKLVTPGKITALISTADGEFCFAALGEKICCWQISNGELLYSDGGRHYQEITCLAVATDSSVLASAGKDNMVIVWDVVSMLSVDADVSDAKPVLHQLCHHSLPVTGLHIGHGDLQHSRLYTASLDNTCKMYDVYSGSLLVSIRMPVAVTAISVDRCETTLYAGTVTGDIYWCHLSDPHLEKSSHADSKCTLHGHRQSVTSLSVSSDGHQLASASEDGDVRVWQCGGSGQCVQTVSLRGGPATNVLFVKWSPQEVTSLPLAPFSRAVDSSVGHSKQRSLRITLDGEHESVVSSSLRVEEPSPVETNGDWTPDELTIPQDFGSDELRRKVAELQSINNKLYQAAVNSVLDR